MEINIATRISFILEDTVSVLSLKQPYSLHCGVHDVREVVRLIKARQHNRPQLLPSQR